MMGFGKTAQDIMIWSMSLIVVSQASTVSLITPNQLHALEDQGEVKDAKLASSEL